MSKNSQNAAKKKQAPRAWKARARVAVVVPAFNEEKNIRAVLDEVRAFADKFPQWWVHPIVVDDGSTDSTLFLLRTIGPEYGATVIHLPINLGIGGAVQTGFRKAVEWGADVTVQLDGDGQHPAEEIFGIIQPVIKGESDVVVGSRYVEGAGGNVSSRARQVGTEFFSLLVRLLTGLKVSDVTSGFRAFSADAVDWVARDYPDDYPEVQTYVPLARLGFRVTEVPVRMRPRQGGVSSINWLRSAYYVVKVGLATVLDRIRPLPQIKRRYRAE